MSTRSVERVLADLLQLEREVVELEYVRRADALERIRDSVRRLGELGSPGGILERAAPELGTSSQLDRVLISEVDEPLLRPRAIWPEGELPPEFRLEYPLIEEEVASRQRVELVSIAEARSRAAPRLAASMAWTFYVVAPLAVHGQTVGLVHADTAESGRALDSLDVEVVALFAERLGGVFERAVLRETLHLHRRELQSAIRWMSGRLGQLASGAGEQAPALRGADRSLIDALTPRELEVLELLCRGESNQAIAGALVVREGTVKYHVKNILRKLGATSRADAVSRYVRSATS